MMTHEQTESLLTAIAAEKDGGRAFPFESRTGGVEFTNYGMTMRDYFAAQAVAAVIARMEHLGYPPKDPHAHAAATAYAIADAMLAARERK